MDIFSKMYIEMILSKEYDEKKEKFNYFLKEINDNLYAGYKKRYPLHIRSQKYIKEFCEKVIELNWEMSKGEYIELNQNNEFFELNVALNITKNSLFPMAIILPYPINIDKVHKVIKDNKMSIVDFNVSDLKKIINPECFDEFDMHIRAKREGRDYLDKIKSKNPIIVMRKNGLVNDYLINGTHRTIQAIKDGEKTIEGYLVGADLCGACGLSKEYETIYWLMKELLFNVYGVDKDMEWTKYARATETLPFH